MRLNGNWGSIFCRLLVGKRKLSTGCGVPPHKVIQRPLTFSAKKVQVYSCEVKDHINDSLRARWRLMADNWFAFHDNAIHTFHPQRLG